MSQEGAFVLPPGRRQGDRPPPRPPLRDTDYAAAGAAVPIAISMPIMLKPTTRKAHVPESIPFCIAMLAEFAASAKDFVDRWE